MMSMSQRGQVEGDLKQILKFGKQKVTYNFKESYFNRMANSGEVSSGELRNE